MIPFNLNLDFKELGTLLNGPLGWGALALAFSSLLILIGMSLVDVNHDAVCKTELERLSTQDGVILDLERELSECISQGETSCIEREQRICRDEKEALKTNCNKLLDEILGGCK